MQNKFPCSSNRGVNGMDNIFSYLSSNSFRGVNIRLYASPDIQYPTPYPNPKIKFRFLWCWYLFISYPANLTLSVPDLNPRKIVTICIRIRRYPTVSDPFTSCKTLVLLWVLLLQVSGLVDVMKPNVLVGWHFLAVAYLFWLWLVPWILIGVFTDTIAPAIHCLGATTHHQNQAILCRNPCVMNVCHMVGTRLFGLLL